MLQGLRLAVPQRASLVYPGNPPPTGEMAEAPTTQEAVVRVMQQAWLLCDLGPHFAHL